MGECTAWEQFHVIRSHSEAQSGMGLWCSKCQFMIGMVSVVVLSGLVPIREMFFTIDDTRG